MPRRLLIAGLTTAGLIIGAAAPAAACAGLVTPSGNIRIGRTSTLAAYADGVEHYVTSFTFSGEAAEFGSIVPLPDVPSKVERGGDWTLQRLEQESDRRRARATALASADAGAGGSAEELYSARIDALDITILRGGGQAVGDWARERGFKLSPDAPEVLDFYADRSPIFMAARFDGNAARERGQQDGEGTPVHLTIPTDNPWVPLRILGLGRASEEFVDASVYLLTERRPTVLFGRGAGLQLELDEEASEPLLADLRSDKGMEWMPAQMWLTSYRVGESAGQLTYDLAVDQSGAARPSPVDAGLAQPRKPPATTLPVETTIAPTPPTALDGTAPGGREVAFQPVARAGRPSGLLGWPLALLVAGAVLAGASLIVRSRSTAVRTR